MNRIIVAVLFLFHLRRAESLDLSEGEANALFATFHGGATACTVCMSSGVSHEPRFEESERKYGRDWYEEKNKIPRKTSDMLCRIVSHIQNERGQSRIKKKTIVAKLRMLVMA